MYSNDLSKSTVGCEKFVHRASICENGICELIVQRNSKVQICEDENKCGMYLRNYWIDKELNYFQVINSEAFNNAHL